MNLDVLEHPLMSYGGHKIMKLHGDEPSYMQDWNELSIWELSNYTILSRQVTSGKVSFLMKYFFEKLPRSELDSISVSFRKRLMEMSICFWTKF